MPNPIQNGTIHTHNSHSWFSTFPFCPQPFLNQKNETTKKDEWRKIIRHHHTRTKKTRENDKKCWIFMSLFVLLLTCMNFLSRFRTCSDTHAAWEKEKKTEGKKSILIIFFSSPFFVWQFSFPFFFSTTWPQWCEIPTYVLLLYPPNWNVKSCWMNFWSAFLRLG